MFNPGLPLVVPAASVEAAWAAQQDNSFALVGEVCRHSALVVAWGPHALYQVVIWVRQRFLALIIVAYACNNA